MQRESNFMKKDKEKDKSFLSMLFDDDFKVNDKVFEEEDDTTFNEIKDRTEELTKEIIEEPQIENTKKEEMTIVSSFPKLDRLGSVLPHKVD